MLCLPVSHSKKNKVQRPLVALGIAQLSCNFNHLHIYLAGTYMLSFIRISQLLLGALIFVAVSIVVTKHVAGIIQLNDNNIKFTLKHIFAHK